MRHAIRSPVAARHPSRMVCCSRNCCRSTVRPGAARQTADWASPDREEKRCARMSPSGRPTAPRCAAGTTCRDGTGRFPTIVMAHGFSAVKEMYLDRYAEAFAKAGFACLVYDNRNFGASDGEPRQEIDPWQQVRDYSDAITFAAGQPQTDAARIGVWGSSYSGAHVLVVSAHRPAGEMRGLPGAGDQRVAGLPPLRPAGFHGRARGAVPCRPARPGGGGGAGDAGRGGCRPDGALGPADGGIPGPGSPRPPPAAPRPGATR